MINVPIAGSGGSITIEVLGYENPGAGNDSDANWLHSKVRVAAGPFAGDIEAALTTQDFAYFERELSEVLRTLQGKATFQTDEDWLRFEVGMGSRGTATVSGAVKASGGSQASLRFSFETDQSYLAQTKRALAEVAKDFPIKVAKESAMTRAGRFLIEEDFKYGVVVRCTDAETADQFEDFLSERNYVFFDIKFEGAEVLFYFGQASTSDSVKFLIERFESDQ